MIVPTHDRPELLSLTLRSVLAQEGVRLEVVVVDDGSTLPLTGVRELADDRVRVLRNESPQGVSNARNRGIEAARGSWVAFCDDDDLWAPRKLAAQLEAASAQRREWAYCGALHINADNRVTFLPPTPEADEAARRLPSWNPIPGGCSNVVVSRDLLAQTGGFDPSLVNLADWDLWIRLGRVGPPAAAPDRLVAYRIHAGSASLDTGLILREVEQLEGRTGARIDHAAIHRYLAWKCVRAGRRRDALRHFAIAASRGETAALRDLVTVGYDRVRRAFGAGPRPGPAVPADAAAWVDELTRRPS